MHESHNKLLLHTLIVELLNSLPPPILAKFWREAGAKSGTESGGGYAFSGGPQILAGAPEHAAGGRPPRAQHVALVLPSRPVQQSG